MRYSIIVDSWIVDAAVAYVMEKERVDIDGRDDLTLAKDEHEAWMTLRNQVAQAERLRAARDG